MRISQRSAVAVALLGAVAPGLSQAVTVRSDGGSDPASIQATVDAFRADLGALNPNPNPGVSFPSGRREINWDGVPLLFTTPNNLPANFFNVNSPRGAVFSGAPAFQVSANVADGAVEFGNIDPTYAAEFRTFSAQKLFTSIGTNVYDITFFLPGTATAASVRGFGAVFTDVDTDASSMLQFYDRNGLLIFEQFVLPGTIPIESLSFLGASFTGARIARVRVTSGNAALGAGVLDGGANDLVVVDDFIFGEPVKVPEPQTLAMLLAGLLGLAGALRRSK